MEVRYPVKVLYTLGTSQLMLARADAIECRLVKPRPNAAKPDEKHASTTLKDCLSALCTASPELLADPRTDHSVYALDPLQTPELMVGRGLLTWLMAESSRVVGTIREDYVDGEEMQVLEIRLSLAPTVAVSRAQHASSLQNISQPPAPTASANPSPPSTPSGLQTTRASMRIRIKSTTRAKEKAAVAAAAPQVPKKRGRQKRSGPPPQAASTPGPVKITSSAPDTPIAGPSVVSPVPSRDHSRVSSVSSLALPQTQAQHQSQPRPPTSFGSTSTSASNQSSQPSRLPSQTPQPQSPNRSLARLLLAASASSSNASNSSNVGTPLFDSLVERLKTTGLLAQLSADQSTATDSQSQALLSFLGRISRSSPDRKGKSREGDGEGKVGATGGAKTLVPSPALTAIRSPTPNPTPSPAPSPAVISAPSPAMLAAPSPSMFATPIPPPDPTRATRKREPEDRADSTEPKRARLGLGDVRSSSLGNLDSHLAKGLKLEDGGYVSASGLGVSPSPASPSRLVASPGFSATSPNFTAPSPNSSALGAPSPNLSVPSPNISAASPYSYHCSASAPPTIPESVGGHSRTWPSSQPTQSLPSGSSQPDPASRSTSQPSLFSADSKPTLGSRKRAPRETPLHAQTDLPLVSGPFVTPRDQIGLPRVPPPPSPVKCVAGPGRAKGGGNKEKKQAGEKEVPAEKGDPGHGKGDTEPDKAQEKDRTVRGVSEEEVRVMLANGYYPPGGLEPGHRRLFGAKNATGEAGDGESDVGKVGSTARAGPTVGRLSTTAPANNYYRTGSSKYYRTSNTTDDPTGPTAQPHASRPQKSSGALRKAPPIPKHSPVALPPVSRLPMMMTSPIRATAGREPDPELAKGRKGKAQKGKGVKPPEPGPVPAAEPARQFPLSLSEYSPLKRFLKSAGVDSLGDVLGQGGVLGLKGDSGWAGWGGSGSNASRAGAKAAMIKEQEREIVDLTSDAEGDDASAPVKAPALAGKSSPEKRPAAPTNVPTTPPRAPRVQPQFSTPRRTSTQPRTPRQARTSPDRAESPLFAQAVLGDAYTQDPSSEGPSIPLDLPPSSPPPMSDSDLEAGSGVDADGKDGYREAVRYTDGASSEGGLGAGEENIEDSDMERQFNPEIDPDDEDGGEWNETIRPPEPDPLEIEPATQDGGLFDGLGAGDAQLDFDTLANFLDTLGGIGTEMTSGPDPEQFDTELAGVLGQTGAHPVDSGLVPAALDFSWLDALGSSNPGEAGLETGAEGIVNLGETGGELAGHDLTEILVALGAG